MTAKQYLEQVGVIRERIMDLNRREEEIRTIAEGLKAIVYDKDHVQVSPQNKMEEVVVELLEVQQKCVINVARLHKEIEAREEQISTLKPAHAKILRLRYLKYDKHGRPLGFHAIANRTGYSLDRAKHIHGEALQAFEDKYKDVLKDKVDTF